MAIINAINGVLWGTPLILLIAATGVFFTIATGFFQFRYFGHLMGQTFGKMMKKPEDSSDNSGLLTPLEAIFSALGGTIGVGSIAGVSTAIATGGPGALFWMWFAGCLGMLIKVVEVALAVYYRKTDEDGNPYGGPTYYMEQGLGKQKGFSLWPIPAFIFGLGIFSSMFLTMQNYTVSEAFSGTFNLPMVGVSAGYVIALYLITYGGIKGVAGVLSFLSPFKIALYMLGGIGILLMDIGNLPSTFASVFSAAFTTQAAVGGFAGAAVMKAVSTGFARMVYSTEAGWGTSPMVHATAQTDHPIKQGMWGAIEVFIATFITMTLTALVVINTVDPATGGSVFQSVGADGSQLVGATLALKAFELKYGFIGRAVISVCILLFGLTVSTGWYVYYEVLLRHWLGDNSSIKDVILKIYKVVYPLPGFLLVVIAVFVGMPGDIVWALADISSGVPTFVNVFCLFILSKTFLDLMKDYKARYLGVGTVDPNFKLFYEDKLKAEQQK